MNDLALLACLKALKAVEWAGWDLHETGDPVPCCPCCGACSVAVGIEPDEATVDAHPGVHCDGCELAAAIALAGCRYPRAIAPWPEPSHEARPNWRRVRRLLKATR